MSVGKLLALRLRLAVNFPHSEMATPARHSLRPCDGRASTKEIFMDDFNNSSDQLTDDAKQAGQDAVNKVRGVATDAKRVAQDAVATGRSYATDAVNAAGRKIDSVKSPTNTPADYCIQLDRRRSA